MPPGSPAMPLLDGTLVDIDLAAGVSDDQAAVAGSCRTWRALVPGRSRAATRCRPRGSGRRAPSQASRIRRLRAAIRLTWLVQSAGLGGVPAEGLDQGVCGRGEGGQLGEGADGDATPVPAGVEQDVLRRRRPGAARRSRCRRRAAAGRALRGPRRRSSRGSRSGCAGRGGEVPPSHSCVQVSASVSEPCSSTWTWQARQSPSSRGRWRRRQRPQSPAGWRCAALRQHAHTAGRWPGSPAAATGSCAAACAERQDAAVRRGRGPGLHVARRRTSADVVGAAASHRGSPRHRGRLRRVADGQRQPHPAGPVPVRHQGLLSRARRPCDQRARVPRARSRRRSRSRILARVGRAVSRRRGRNSVQLSGQLGRAHPGSSTCRAVAHAQLRPRQRPDARGPGPPRTGRSSGWRREPRAWQDQPELAGLAAPLDPRSNSGRRCE